MGLFNIFNRRKNMDHDYDKACMCHSCCSYEYALRVKIADEQKEIKAGKEKYMNRIRYEKTTSRKLY